jgi:ABC-type polysaccharide/polyol phosphate transport system ATPase subunit/SAM-dependent methyltransferase
MRAVIQLDDVSKRYWLRRNRTGELKVRFLGLFHKDRRETRDELWALRHVSITIGEGESVGLIGRNGSGKSTLLKLVAGIHEPTSGRVRVARGARVGTLIELGVGFHPELSGRENVFLNAAIHGLTRPAIEALYPAVVDYAGLRDFMDVPLKNYSSGMQMRLGFAVAANLDPDILLLDEIFAVGDEEFQKQCRRTLSQFLAAGKTILFVSHAAASVRAVCRRVCLIEHGQLLYDGGVDGGFNAYHRLMLASAPYQPPAPAADGAPAPATAGGTGEPWHRVSVGGAWDEIGTLQFEFLKRQGLQPSHALLDVGCGSLRGGVHFMRYLEPGRYFGIDCSEPLIRAGIEIELPAVNVDPSRGTFIVNDNFQLDGVPPLDFALAQGLFPEVPLGTVITCIAAVVRRLAPGGRFYVTYFEDPNPAETAAVVQPSGVVTYPDMFPYHLNFEVLAGLCRTVGARAERVTDWQQSRGQVMALITRA